jgi:hypothetical protein
MAWAVVFHGRHMAQPLSPKGDAVVSHTMPPSLVEFNHMVNHYSEAFEVDMMASHDTSTVLVKKTGILSRDKIAARR